MRPKIIIQNLWFLRDKNTGLLATTKDDSSDFGKTQLGQTLVFTTRKIARQAKFENEKIVKARIKIEFYY